MLTCWVVTAIIPLSDRCHYIIWFAGIVSHKSPAMEKILVPFNSLVYTPVALDFASYLARLTGSGITGLFLDGAAQAADKDAVAKYDQLVAETTRLFRDGCEARSVCHSEKRLPGSPAGEVIIESRYADLIVMDATTSMDDTPEETPTVFVRNVLAKAECPSIIAPPHFEQIDEIIFMYNGSRSSVFAARQFAYMFPQLDDRPVSVVEVSNGHTIPERDRNGMKNWVKEHYSSIGFTTIEGDPDAALLAYLLPRKNALVITGAYGRNALSRFFHRSTAEMLIKIMSHAFFVAHY